MNKSIPNKYIPYAYILVISLVILGSLPDAEDIVIHSSITGKIILFLIVADIVLKFILSRRLIPEKYNQFYLRANMYSIGSVVWFIYGLFTAKEESVLSLIYPAIAFHLSMVYCLVLEILILIKNKKEQLN